MRKFWPLLLILVSSIFIFSCKDDDDDNYVDNDTYAAVYDLENVSFAYNATDGWNIYQAFNGSLYDSDVVLIFRQTGTSNGNPIWQQIPRTLYLTEGELDYDFDFTINDFYIYAGGTIDFASQTQSFKDAYLNNQTFRVVLVPASFGKNTNTTDITKLSYEEVIKKYNIDDSNVKTLK